MGTRVKNLETEALRLSQDDRAELARVLLLSLDETEAEATERVWAEEAERRYLELENGAVSAIPSDEVTKEARTRLK
jgi:putative addiction module component (TIGR02574 family)